MILLWDVDSGLAQIDKYLNLTENHVLAGALLGVGIVNCGIKNDCDPVSSCTGFTSTFMVSSEYLTMFVF